MVFPGRGLDTMERDTTSQLQCNKTADAMMLDAKIDWWDTPVVTAGAILALSTLGTMLWRNKRREEVRDLPVGWNENDYFSDMVSTLSETQLRKTIANYGLPQNLVDSQAHYIHNNGSDDWVVRSLSQCRTRPSSNRQRETDQCLERRACSSLPWKTKNS